jgi:hypothetical protein
LTIEALLDLSPVLIFDSAVASLVRRPSSENGEGYAFVAPALDEEAVIALERDFGTAVSATGWLVSGKPEEPALFAVAEKLPGGGSTSRLGGLWVPSSIADQVERVLARLGHVISARN